MRAVLFDVDGVLLDSWAGYREVWGRWCALRGVDLELAWAATLGRRPVETVAEVAPYLNPAAEYLVLQQLLADCAAALPAFAAAKPLLDQLPAGAWAVVTSGQRQAVMSRFASAGLPLPAVLVDSDDVTAGKPSPEGFLLAARLLRVDRADCLVVEDAPAGVRAGKAAGMTVLAVASTHDPAELAEADDVRTSLAEATPAVLHWLRPQGTPVARGR